MTFCEHSPSFFPPLTLTSSAPPPNPQKVKQSGWHGQAIWQPGRWRTASKLCLSDKHTHLTHIYTDRHSQMHKCDYIVHLLIFHLANYSCLCYAEVTESPFIKTSVEGGHMGGCHTLLSHLSEYKQHYCSPRNSVLQIQQFRNSLILCGLFLKINPIIAVDCTYIIKVTSLFVAVKMQRWMSHCWRSWEAVQCFSTWK